MALNATVPMSLCCPCHGEEAKILKSLSLQLKTKDVIIVTELITQRHIYFVTLLNY